MVMMISNGARGERSRRDRVGETSLAGDGVERERIESNIVSVQVRVTDEMV